MSVFDLNRSASDERLLAEARERESQELNGRELATRWAMAAGFLAVAVPLAVLAPTDRSTSPLTIAAFVVAYAIASRVSFEVGSGMALPTELVIVPMLFELPARVIPLALAAGLLLGAMPSFVRRTIPPGRAVVLLASSWFSLGPALVFLAAGEPSAGRRGIVVLVVAVLAQFAFDLGSASASEWFALGLHPRELAGPLGWAFAIDALLAPVGFVAAEAARVDRLALFLPLPLLGLLALFARERRERIDHVLELSSAYRGTALLLGDVVEADDEYTGDHSRQVVGLVLAVCDRLGVDERTRRNAEFTALLHDVGKIKIPAEIIEKPGPLTPPERAVIQTHTIEGELLLRRVGGLLAEIGGLVRSCHEHHDGRGYPDGLAGEEIPLIARIVSCCDAYNAMTTDRPYRKARKAEAAIAELLANRGTQFDPLVVDTLLEVLQEREPAAQRFAVLGTCPRCLHATLLSAPTGDGRGVCLRCGMIEGDTDPTPLFAL